MSNSSSRTSTISSASHSGNGHAYHIQAMQRAKQEHELQQQRQMAAMQQKQQKLMMARRRKQFTRSIGRWRIGETLGKGGYSWVKKGYDKKTGKCVALKFMRKADSTWAKEQSKQVVTEIECLKQIRHKNVLKLYAYNLNAKYPTNIKKKKRGNSSGNESSSSYECERISTILLVLEYAPGGEIFDILYYTRALEPILARTYFRQTVLGLEACHNAGVAHRDIKPQNLLLDSRFNLKICDFGLSKLFESDADAIMQTSYVGTRGYQAPELLLQKSYDLSCDIFSLGVVLFILITGYPPFEQAAVTDRWFKPLAQGNNSKFWKLHKGCSIRKDEKCKDLLQRMLAFDPSKRITINQIKKHPWFKEGHLEGKDLIRALRRRHHEMELKRREDGRKLKDLQTSIPITRKIEFGKSAECNEYPVHEIEGCNDNEQYTQTEWKKVYDTFQSFVTKNSGQAVYDQEDNNLKCRVKFGNSQKLNEFHEISFTVNVYKSRQYTIQIDEKTNDDTFDYCDKENDSVQTDQILKTMPIYVVKLVKQSGTTQQWTIFRNNMLTKCQNAVTGLPQWAKEINDVSIESNDVDDYDEELNNAELWDNNEDDQ